MRWTLLLAALLAALVLVPVPAYADLTLTGTPVTPAANALSAPVLSSGRYVATLAASTADSYLQVKRTVPGSTLWVGATLDLGRGSDAKDFEGSLFLNGYADGATTRECWGDDAIVSTPSSATGGQGTPHFETWLESTGRGDPACRTAKSVTLEFSPFDWTPPADTQVQLVVWEQPPVGDVSGQQAPSDNVTWNPFPDRTPTALRPGTTWSEAPDISDASVSFHLDRGQVGVFRMPLDWGQHAQALVATDQKVGEDLPDLSVWWASPMGGAVREPKVQGAPGDVYLGSEDGPSSVAATTPTVSYRNRELSYAQQPDSPSVAGDYFLVVYVGTKGIPAGGMDLTLQSGFYTDYAGAAPPYRSSPPPLAQVADFDPARSDGDGHPATGSLSRSGRPWPVVAALGGGALLFALLGVAGGVLLARRGRARS